MERQAVEEPNANLTEFTDDVFAYLAYAGQRGYGRGSWWCRVPPAAAGRRSTAAPSSLIAPLPHSERDVQEPSATDRKATDETG
jgi:hypothetical protein